LPDQRRESTGPAVCVGHLVQTHLSNRRLPQKWSSTAANCGRPASRLFWGRSVERFGLRLARLLLMYAATPHRQLSRKREAASGDSECRSRFSSNLPQSQFTAIGDSRCRRLTGGSQTLGTGRSGENFWPGCSHDPSTTSRTWTPFSTPNCRCGPLKWILRATWRKGLRALSGGVQTLTFLRPRRQPRSQPSDLVAKPLNDRVQNRSQSRHLSGVFRFAPRRLFSESRLVQVVFALRLFPAPP
jgi:hypothetical protein